MLIRFVWMALEIRGMLLNFGLMPIRRVRMGIHFRRIFIQANWIRIPREWISIRAKLRDIEFRLEASDFTPSASSHIGKYLLSLFRLTPTPSLPLARGAGFPETEGVSPTLPAKTKSSVPLSVFLAVALLSSAVLGFEIALSRVFATTLRFQFAFLIVSLALCGLGLGGLWAHLRPRTSLENAALGWGVAVVASLAVILRGVFAIVPQHYWLAALFVVVPFCFAGAFLSLVFGAYREEGGRLYGFDLGGAALAAVGSVALMQVVSAIDACLFFAALGALAGVLVSKRRAFPAILCATLLAMIPFNLRFHAWSVQPIPPMPDKDGNTLADRGITQFLFTELGDPKSKTKISDTRWNAFARTDVVNDPDEGPDSLLIYTNGNVPTNMLHWRGDLRSLPQLTARFPISNWTFESANIGNQEVFSIGPGGGLDALLALQYGAKHFEGAEINPSIVGLMNEPDYRNWNGGIYRNPRVHVRTAEGRDAVRETKGRYRLVFSALTKTATAGQGAALLESFIYTREAFNDYLNAADDDGAMAIVGDAPALLARLTATAVDHFKRMGQTEHEAGQHIAVVYADARMGGPYRWALFVRKSPITPAQAALMAQSASKKKLYAIWIPGQAADNPSYPFGLMLSGALSLDAFIASGRQTTQQEPMAADFSPCSDDKPFVLDMSPSPMSLFDSSPSLTWMLGLSLLSTLGLAGFLSLSPGKRATFPPAISETQRETSATTTNVSAIEAITDAALSGVPAVQASASATQARTRAVAPIADLSNALGPLLFLALGVGFMFVEVPLIQKLALPLGYPTLSLSVILFSILLGGGAGALFSQRFEGASLRRYALACALGVVALSLGFGFASDVAGRALLDLPITTRCVVVALSLLPFGFVLGTPFPSGLRLLARDERTVALAWALNGTASVVGSIGAAILAKSLGFTLVMAFGALIYAGVAGVFAANRQG